MFQRDALSQFLHTSHWQHVSGGQMDHCGNVYLYKTIPKARYFLSTRAFIPENWTFPGTPSSLAFARIQPDSEQSLQNALTYFSQYNHKKVPSIQPIQTSVVDLSPSLHAILHKMKPKHRYNIKVAQKHGIVCTRHSKDAADHLQRFWHLLTKASDRHDFHTHSLSHYQSILESDTKNCVELWFATKEDRDLAAAMVIRNHETATYLHGGSNHEFRKYMAPYLLHYEIMKYHKENGALQYDLWGVNTRDGAAIPNHPSSGVTRFKLGFGGTLVTYPPTVDIIFKPAFYLAYRAIVALKRRKRAFS